MTICDRSILKILLLLLKKKPRQYFLHRHIIVYTQSDCKHQKNMFVHNCVPKPSFVNKKVYKYKDICALIYKYRFICELGAWRCVFKVAL
ncbi:MAG: hypothetical protein ACKPKO_33605 [Candidatus Fonsibacter sp.]